MTDSTNPFSGLITSEMRQLWVDAISALVESCGLGNPCILEYGYTKTSECPNCIYDPTSRRSSGRYKTGGEIPFANGKTCPVCSGRGVLEEPSTETIYLCPIWNHREWMPMSGMDNIRNPLSFVQTISKISTSREKIQQAKSCIIDSNRYERYGDSEPIGFGEPTFIATLWRFNNVG